MIYVTVRTPLGRQIYINGVYDEVAGISGLAIPLQPGSHTFETLTFDANVDFRGSVEDVPDETSQTVDLAAVIPPASTV